jgi:hypothetical protein
MGGRPVLQSLQSVTASVLLSFALLSGCKTVPLQSPVRVHAAKTPVASRSAIVRALLDQNYTVDEESVGRVRGRLQTSSWIMVIDVKYDDSGIGIYYADSVGMHYATDRDSPTIHQGYNVRVQALADEIRHQVQRGSLMSQPAPAAAGEGAKPTP